jgi:murein DD-endopeptidase MepM/ murein hydrolase activator NlpD
VCRQESQYYVGAYNFQGFDRSYGLWQVNMKDKMGPERLAKYNLKANEDLYIPEVNARIMVDMSAKGTNWKPWGAYTSGAYEKYLDEATKAVKDLEKEMAPKPVVKKVVEAVKKVVTPAPVVWDDVKPGDTSDSVKAVQNALIKLKFPIPAGATGYWGQQTTDAYSQFQRSLGFTGNAADGAPGGLSLAMLAKRAGLTLKKRSVPPRVASPVPGYKVTYAYGVKNTRYAAGYHTGDDYAAPAKTPVVAVVPGKIEWSNANGGAYGNWIGLRGDNGRVYVYCHLSYRSVYAGQRVTAGQQLGRVGATGNVTGPHLHFEDHPTGPFLYGRCRKPAW